MDYFPTSSLLNIKYQILFTNNVSPIYFPINEILSYNNHLHINAVISTTDYSPYASTYWIIGQSAASNQQRQRICWLVVSVSIHVTWLLKAQSLLFDQAYVATHLEIAIFLLPPLTLTTHKDKQDSWIELLRSSI